MSTRATTPPPIDCDVCGNEITATKGGFLDCEVVDLHDGTPVKDVCRSCTSKPLSVIFPHVTERTSGHPMRRVPGADVAVAGAVELEAGEEEEEIPPEKLAEKQK